MAKRFHNMSLNYEDCIADLEENGQETFPGSKDGVLWCNATWDTVLCWPAIPAGTNLSVPCPPLKGLDTARSVSKQCHSSGRWMGKTENDFSNPSGWTDYISCMKLRLEHADDPFQKAQSIANGVRILEITGLGISLVALVLAILLLVIFKRLRVFRNIIRVQLMLAILFTVVIRLVFYVDLIFTEKIYNQGLFDGGYTIHTTKYLCEAFYLFFEFYKTAAITFMFIEACYLHNKVVLTLFRGRSMLRNILLPLIGWLYPLINAGIWVIFIVIRRETVETCFGLYFLHVEYWIMDLPRYMMLLFGAIFLIITGLVLCCKRAVLDAQFVRVIKNNVITALVIIPILVIPIIMQFIQFSPTKDSITYFAVVTYTASVFYVFQGFMIAVVYCFANCEVWRAIKSRNRPEQGDHSAGGTHQATDYQWKSTSHSYSNEDAKTAEPSTMPLLKASYPVH